MSTDGQVRVDVVRGHGARLLRVNVWGSDETLHLTFRQARELHEALQKLCVARSWRPRMADTSTPRDVIAQAVYRPVVTTEQFDPAMQSMLDEESALYRERAYRDADMIIGRLAAVGFSISGAVQEPDQRVPGDPIALGIRPDNGQRSRARYIVVNEQKNLMLDFGRLRRRKDAARRAKTWSAAVPWPVSVWHECADENGALTRVRIERFTNGERIPA